MRENSTPLNSPPARPDPGIPWGRRLAAWPVALLVRLWLASLRIEVSPESQRVVSQTARPVVFALWHNRLFIAPAMVRRFRRRPLYALISMSGDGGWLTALFAALNVAAVRGSSSRGGREATADAIEILGGGGDLGITPDGPRGPAYAMKPGAIVVARRAAAALVLAHVDYHSAWRLRSWDGFYVPKPFSRVRVQLEDTPLRDDEDAETAARRVGARLTEMTIDRLPTPVRRRG